MKIYIIGEIVYKNKNNIILESKGEGYWLTVADDWRYQVNQKAKIFIYEHQTDYQKNTYGFKDFKERLLFIDLVSIEKIGPRIAMNILNKGWEYIARLIATNNTTELSTIPFVTEKVANIICVQLNTKWSKILTNSDNKKAETAQIRDEVAKTLQTLGFKKAQIDYALKQIKYTNNMDEMIENSIQLIAAQQNEQQRSTAN
ncbi:Holliday junction branch migration protein RuvA [Mycoplasma sp. Pen4]|uniref:Holliday junction branch migration protein RuvA n=1 Tax=Mycoplasma sp. Pen4 TaxID=640330 RepID=UPI0016544D90|nr:Holliday junction branch migration protein RuvA [Mycoplasma sp. Pen4]QNM93316.1 Holliday junction branch migration protein RuvA [Mycoplasma sp. Pen4]